ncbi:rhodanese-like domain-containing protein 6 isoform X1 [Tripterygium wilfordii]|uniref:rhodanese-like domain-containing protein 6 isoform X1 n=1 Tax=Tripterygium wilfordii TaxID=458696 RepID=UPI0018F823A2|nr:rhodanese-like domain-containing protein 6 isoform X1 [Tripterygium wilfordii]
MSLSMSDDEARDQGRYGVLLYYKYTSIPDLDNLVSFYRSNCDSLRLLGRVRVAPHGVNVTVGGELSSVERHIAAVKGNSLFEGTDFKLATCDYPLNEKVARECGFTSLSVRVVKELVTFSCHPLLKSPDISNAGRHLNAAEFHSVIESAERIMDKDGPTKARELVLLDARNLYETRIGKFQSPNVETLDPRIRQYSDLPSWIDENSERLRGKHVLMYCTGGIRCEMASAYLRSKGAGFENVFQLFGGIQRYLEQFPDGGFFKGKNFVFDHRISVGSSDADVKGTCLLCGLSFDDYSPRCRCSYCRMLVLVCDSCRMEDGLYVCELCQKHRQLIEVGKSRVILPQIEPNTISLDAKVSPLPLGHGTGCPRKLRILCLHGFRQNASSFKGRTASLAKKLKSIADLVFVDAAHELPFIYQPSFTELQRDSASSPSEQIPAPPSENCRKKFAWLVAPGFSDRFEKDWKVADGPFDPLQYQQQTGGLDVSLTYLKDVFSREGPFDGILGFSQGAAIAASVAAQRGRLLGDIDFRFVILCSGFALHSPELDKGSINCPSLHIFGNDLGKDRQIASQASRELASLFEDGCSIIIEHDFGHIIPTRSPYMDEIKDFLRRFL